MDAHALYVKNAWLVALVGVAIKIIIANAVVCIVETTRSSVCMAIAHHAKRIKIVLIVYACTARLQRTRYSNAVINFVLSAIQGLNVPSACANTVGKDLK